jgi:hypothetical protein
MTAGTGSPNLPAVRAARPLAAAALFVLAAAIVLYWLGVMAVEVTRDRPHALLIAVLLVSAAATALLPVLAAVHFLQLPAERFARWRLPGALALALVALPMVVMYGIGFYPAVGALVLARRARRLGAHGPALWAARILSWIGVAGGALMLLAAVGLCGPRIVGGICDA